MKAVHLRAVDWGTYHGDNVPPSTPFKPVLADLIGFVVQEDDVMIVLTQQIFDDGDYRGVLVIPKVCIVTMTVLGRTEGGCDDRD